MRAFQDEGHTGVLIVGDYTTRIGDPSGRSAERPDPERRGDRRERAETYLDQAMVILDPERTEVSATTASGSPGSSYADVVRLARTITVARILERDDFEKRYGGAGADLGLRAALPAHAGLRLGRRSRPTSSSAGTDQLYNLLAGREVMPHYGLEPQVVLTTPLLLAWDGAEDELVGRQQHPAHRGSRGDVRRARCGSRTTSCREWYAADRGARAARRRPARGEARAGAVHRPALARRGGRARSRGALHPRRPPPRGAGGRARGRAPERRSGAPAGAARRALWASGRPRRPAA